MSDSELEPQSEGHDELSAIAASLDGEDVSAEAEPAESAEQLQLAVSVDTAAEVDPGESVEPAEPVEPVEPVAPVEQPEQPESVEPVTSAAPTPVEPAEPAPAEAPAFLGAIDETAPTGAPTWPFVVYEGAWAVFAAAIVFALRDVPEGPLYAERLYAISVVTGLALTALGPILIIVVWLFSGGTRKGQRGSKFVSALLKGAVATFLGVVLWIVALVILDQLRLGSVF